MTFRKVDPNSAEHEMDHHLLAEIIGLVHGTDDWQGILEELEELAELRQRVADLEATVLALQDRCEALEARQDSGAGAGEAAPASGKTPGVGGG